MRQETIVKTYLKFSELSKTDQNKVIEKMSNINVNDSFWYDFSMDEFKAKLEKLGFYKIEVEFSGFSSQGDGARFSAKHRRGDIETYGRYSHSGSMRSDSNLILEVGKRLADRFYSQLSKEYDYLTSREAIIETIEANDYEFDKDTLELA